MRNSLTNKLSIALICLAVFCASAFAQTAPAASRFGIVGASFSGTTVTPFAGFAQELSGGSGVYSITSVQVTKINLKPIITFQTVTSEDIGYDFTKLLPAQYQSRFHLIGLGGAGASTSASTLSGAFDGGGLGGITTKHFDIAIGARVIKTAQSGIQTVPIAAVYIKL